MLSDLLDGERGVGCEEVLHLAGQVGALHVVDVHAPFGGGALAGRVDMDLPHDARLTPRPRAAHEVLRRLLRERRRQEPGHPELPARLVEAPVLFRQPPAPEHNAVWRELDDLDGEAANDEQHADGAHDDGEVRGSRCVVHAQQAVDDVRKLALVLQRRLPAAWCVCVCVCTCMLCVGVYVVYKGAHVARECLHVRMLEELVSISVTYTWIYVN